MTHKIQLCAITVALSAALTGEVYGQTSGSTTGGVAPPAATQPGVSPRPAGQAPSTNQAPARSAPQQGSATGATVPPAGGTTTTGPAGITSNTSGAITGGLPTMGGITPGRAELAGSAFTKLDAGSRGYVTLEEVRQLDGFESAFRQGDQNGDGRLNPSEFNSAWAIYTGNVR